MGRVGTRPGVDGNTGGDIMIDEMVLGAAIVIVGYVVVTVLVGR